MGILPRQYDRINQAVILGYRAAQSDVGKQSGNVEKSVFPIKIKPACTSRQLSFIRSPRHPTITINPAPFVIAKKWKCFGSWLIKLNSSSIAIQLSYYKINYFMHFQKLVSVKRVNLRTYLVYLLIVDIFSCLCETQQINF